MTRSQKIIKLSNRDNDSQLIDYVRDNSISFNSLINTYLEGPYRRTQRLAGAVTQIATETPALLKPHFKRIIDALNDPHASTALKRNTIRMFQFVPVPGNRQGELIDICFRYLQDKNETIAVKVFSMSVLELLTSNYPELRRELRIVLEDQLTYAGPAFRSRGFKVLKKLISGGADKEARQKN
jgi:hypothetical protein